MYILILHGIQSHAGAHWQRWLKAELENLKHTVYMPDLPDASHPDRFEWLRYIKQITKDVPLSKLIIVGHSLGVVSALDFIEQSDKKIFGLISVAGFAEDYGSDLNGYFMRQKELDTNKIMAHLQHAFVVYGDNDPFVPQEALQNLSEMFNVKRELIIEGGHLNTQSGYTEFPLLLDIINQLNSKKK